MSNKIVINNIPSTRRSRFGFNKVNKSKDHNMFQEEVLSDILDLFNRTNNIEKEYIENIEYLKLENSYINSLNEELIKKYEDLKNRVENLNLKDKAFIINPIDCLSKETEYSLGADIDLVTNSITAKPSKKVSKLSIFDSITDSIYLPKSLNIQVVDTTEGSVISSEDNNILAPFYSDDELYFTRKCITDNTSSSVTYDYIITLPSEIMTSTDINEIFIEPFLANIEGVYTRHGDSSNWELVEGFEYNSLNKETGFINFSKAVKFNFRNTKANQIKVSLRCNMFTERETNTRRFLSGIKQVGVYLNYYNLSSPSSFQFDIELPDNHDYIIKDIIPYFNNGTNQSVYSKDFYYDIYTKDELGYEYKVVDTFPFRPSRNHLVFKCRFGERYSTSNISKIEIKYSHV